MRSDFVFSSESVTAGHPDKLCDQISDKIVAGYLAADPDARVVAETAISTGIVFNSVRFGARVSIDTASLVREVIAEAGYIDGRFNARTCTVMSSLIEQSRAPAKGAIEERLVATELLTTFGFACNHTPELMPLPITLAHKLTRRLDQLRREAALPYLTPDGKAQVSVEFKARRPHRVYGVVIHAGERDEGERHPGQLEAEIRERVIDEVFAHEPIRIDEETRVFISGAGKGGPYAHAGLTGRKGGTDTYGGFSRRTDSALSGKDPTRVERIGSYGARYAAKQVVAAGLAEHCEVQLSYFVGLPGPVSVQVETFGTGRVEEEEIVRRLRSSFDFRVGALIERFGLRQLDADALYPRLARYGHFGRDDMSLPWEAVDAVDALRR